MFILSETTNKYLEMLIVPLVNIFVRKALCVLSGKYYVKLKYMSKTCFIYKNVTPFKHQNFVWPKV